MNRTHLLAAAGSAALFGGYCLYENNTFSVGRYHLKKGLSAPIRIVQIADLHGKIFGRGGRRLLSAVKSLAPDLIVLTGDTVGTDCHHLVQTAHLLGSLCRLAPVYAVTGNHELRSNRLSEILLVFRCAGVTILRNEIDHVERNGVSISILGLCEHQAVSRMDYLRAMTKTLSYTDNRPLLARLAQEEGLRLVLSHFPENFARIGDLSYNRFDFDVMFAGHAHGGQVRLPLLGGVYAPGQGLFPPYDAGLYPTARLGGPTLLLSRGLGNDVPIPRINNRPELVLLTVE